MKFSWRVLTGLLFVLIFTALKVVLFDLVGINFESQANQVSRFPSVDLGYATYKGFRDNNAGINTWLGIRYAAPPTGQLRWQAPRAPLLHNSSVIEAKTSPPQCPQAGCSPGASSDIPTGDEDCLFLNVYAPPDAHNLPVMVWIHGGGYAQGNAGQFPLPLLSFRKDFIGVAIQYRLGAFGFLSSAAVHTNGALNVGLLDQHFALQWVQDHIYLFGGDRTRVTVAGQSAGAGAVMLHATAYAGTLGTTIFDKLIAASPYLPTQYNYSDSVPTNLFDRFAGAVNCTESTPQDEQLVLECLRSRDTNDLQTANVVVSASGPYGTWTFVPVTDNSFLPDQPGSLLAQGKVNGAKILTSNMANEGPLFMPQNLTDLDSLTSFISILYPSASNISFLLSQYPISSADLTPPTPYATNGTSSSVSSSALLTSSWATGFQQIANNIYAEMTFVCPSYWVAEAFSSSSNHTTTNNTTIPIAYKYEYDIPAAPHSYDLVALNSGPNGSPSDGLGPDSATAFLTAWNNFITTGDPTTESAGGNHATNDTFQWPVWTNLDSDTGRKMVSWNQTCPQVYLEDYIHLADAPRVAQCAGPGWKNEIEVVDAWEWELGRGERCEKLRDFIMSD